MTSISLRSSTLVLSFVVSSMPEEDDPLGGVLRIWEHEDKDGDGEPVPVGVVEVVNFRNPIRPRPNPAAAAIRDAEPLDENTNLRCGRGSVPTPTTLPWRVEEPKQ